MAMSRIHAPLVATSSTPVPRKVEAPGKSDKAFAGHLQSEASSKQFAAHIDTEKENARHRTFSFFDLGTLGIHAWAGSGAAQASSAGHSQNTNPSGSVTEAAAVLPQDTANSLPPQEALAHTSATPCVSALDLAPASVELHFLSENIGGSNAAGSLSDPEAVEGESEAAVAPAVRSSMPDNRATPPVSVTVSGPDEALVITARVLGEEVTDPKLQRVFETAVADFDMQISELRLNGSQAQSPTIGKNAYGYSSR